MMSIDMIAVYLCKLCPPHFSLLFLFCFYPSLLLRSNLLNQTATVTVIISIKEKPFLNIQVALQTSAFLVKCLVRLMVMPPSSLLFTLLKTLQVFPTERFRLRRAQPH